ncbi:MAG: DUF4145 domain-containing protein [Candidatus Micrarchaeaceae archaeon]
MKTEVLSIRVRKDLKEEADNLGIDVKKTLEEILEEMVAAKKQKSSNVANELNKLMNVTAKEWLNGVRTSRKER